MNTISYAYDVVGRLTRISDANGTWAYTYDGEGRMLTADNNGTANMPRTIISNTYDVQGRRASQTTSVGGVVQSTDTYTYDALGRLVAQAQTGGNAKGVKYSYRADGSYDTITRYGDATFTTVAGSSVYGYDDAGFMTSLVHRNASGAAIVSYSWTYDAAGRITNFTSPDGSKDYTYDANDQVKSATGEQGYSYDNAGNRTMSGYVTTANNRLADDGTYTYQYDNEGNRTKRTLKSDSSYVTYAYDHRNRLTDVTFYTSAGVKTKATRYVYDANDQRIRRELDATGDGIYETIEKYVYNKDDVILVLNGSDTVTARYLFGNQTDQVLAEDTGTVKWQLADHQGSVRDVADAFLVTSHYTYETFGRITSPAQPTRFGYTGREWDAAAEMYYYRARWYDQNTGRFLSEDPKGFGAGDMNLYRYVGNNAVNLVDPDGMMAAALKSTVSTIGNAIFSTAASAISSALPWAGSQNWGAAAARTTAQINLTNGGLQYLSGGTSYNLSTLNAIQSDMRTAGWSNDRISSLMTYPYQQVSAVAQTNVDRLSGISGVFNVAESYYANAGNTLLNNATYAKSQAGAASYAFVGQTLNTFGSMLNVPAQRDSRIAESTAYQQMGVSSFDSWLLSSAQRVPVTKSIVNVEEMSRGTSASAFNIGQALNGWDYAQKSAGVVADAAFVGAWLARPVVPSNAVNRYVGAGEAQKAAQDGFIPNVDYYGRPKPVFVTPDKSVASPLRAETIYQIGSRNPVNPYPTPTHVLTGNAKGITFDYGGNVAGGSGIELVTRQQIPAVSVRPIGVPLRPVPAVPVVFVSTTQPIRRP